ncbi:MAG: peptide-methionine (R)-S-oxide reductase MsrB [Patescibacteria group bacterium]
MKIVFIIIGIILLVAAMIGFFYIRKKNNRTAQAFAGKTVLPEHEADAQAQDSGEDSELHGGKTEEEWKQILSKLQFLVLHEEGTEQPFTSDLLKEKRPGTYVTADCEQPVFRSEDKFESGTGWPSFTRPISDDALIFVEDYSLGVKRIEVRGSKCNTHLGHVFPDGPPEETGLRYCINGAALKFVPDEEVSQK